MKTLTFSYDDGGIGDIRLVELFHKYGMKATFNLNSEMLGTVAGIGQLVNREDVRHIYEGHEIAVHTLTHPNLTELLDDAEVIRQVEQDRIALSELAGYEVVGMAYPCGGTNHDERVIRLIDENTGVRYARTITSTYEFKKPDRLLELNPTIWHYEMDKMFELGETFLKLPKEDSSIFYIWGHSFEFDRWEGSWERFEEFLKMMSGRTDIRYCTNKEIF